MIDISVFKSLLKKETYLKYKNIIFQIPNMEPEIEMVLNTIRSYYSEYEEKELITVDELKLHFSNSNPVIKSPENYVALLDRLYDADINNVELLIKSINRLAETATASVILQECVQLVNSYEPDGLRKINQHLEFYEGLVSSVSGSEADVCTLTLDELLKLDSAEFGIPWKLPFLQSTIGSLKGGTLGHIFAYPETGKTSLGLFEAVHMAYGLVDTECVLYLANEESVTRSKLRAYSAFLNMEPDRIREHSKKAEEIFQNDVNDRLKFIDECDEINKIERYIQDFRPRVAFIDQGAKVAMGGKAESDVKRLQQLYNVYRRLAVRYNTVIITLGQADASCENKKHLKLGNMDSSKIGIPGELDVAIGIGKTDDVGYEKRRYLSVCKNKLTGILGKGEVTFDHKRCSFKADRRS